MMENKNCTGVINTRNEMMKIINQLAIIVSTIIFLGSCATSNSSTDYGARYVVKVDSYGEDSLLTKKNCFLFLSDTTINTSDLQYKEFYGFISKTLIDKGYKIVDSISSANIVVLFNYGISDPTTKDYTKSVPIYGQTGVSSSTTTGNVNVNPYSNKIQYTQNTKTTPNYGITGYSTVHGSTTTFNRFLNMVALDNDYFISHQKEIRLWQIEVTSEGASDDLRKVFPFMIVGAKNYIGHSSGEKKEIGIYENNLDVRKLKGDTLN
jgi:hypothetical protein